MSGGGLLCERTPVVFHSEGGRDGYRLKGEVVRALLYFYLGVGGVGVMCVRG